MLILLDLLYRQSFRALVRSGVVDYHREQEIKGQSLFRRTPMDHIEQGPSPDIFGNLINNYGGAFDNYHPQAIINSYNTPCFVCKSGTLFANLTEGPKLRYFTEMLDSYRQKDYSKAEFPHCDVKLLGLESALATVEWLFKWADGQSLSTLWIPIVSSMSTAKGRFLATLCMNGEPLLTYHDCKRGLPLDQLLGYQRWHLAIACGS